MQARPKNTTPTPIKQTIAQWISLSAAYKNNELPIFSLLFALWD
jgi:hypothetical protein